MASLEHGLPSQNPGGSPSIPASAVPEARPAAEREVRPATPLPGSRRHSAAWVWQVTVLSLLLGVMLAVALRTESRLRGAGLPTSRFGARAGVAYTLKESNDRLQDEVKQLRQRTASLETTLAQRSSSAAALTRELSDLQLRAGLVPVEGAGLIITLRDSPLKGEDAAQDQLKIVHDNDLNMILGELKAAGAETLGIAGADREKIQRVIYSTTVRCTGPGMDVNDTRLGGPYTIYAIGNPKELRAQLEMKAGVVKTLGLNELQMITIQESQKIIIPEYTGSFSFKHAKPSNPPR